MQSAMEEGKEQFYKYYQGFWNVLECTGMYWNVKKFTVMYWGVQECAGIYWDVQGSPDIDRKVL